MGECVICSVQLRWQSYLSVMPKEWWIVRAKKQSALLTVDSSTEKQQKKQIVVVWVNHNFRLRHLLDYSAPLSKQWTVVTEECCWPLVSSARGSSTLRPTYFLSLVACFTLLFMSDYAYSPVYMNHKWTEEEEGNRECTVGRVAFSLNSPLTPQRDSLLSKSPMN